MTGPVDQARAKALITVSYTGSDSCRLPSDPAMPSPPAHLLLSVKAAPFSDKDGHLEFLGGQLENREEPYKGLIRELQEEEPTGRLATLAMHRACLLGEFFAEGCKHNLFHFCISSSEYIDLIWDEEESHGFMLVPQPFLDANRASLTPKTRTLLEQMQKRALDPFALGL